jgi:hypothetical protein
LTTSRPPDLLLLRRLARHHPLRRDEEVGQEPLGDGGGRGLRGVRGALSWGGGDEGKGLGAGLALDGTAGEGLEAEHLVVAVIRAWGEGRER